MKLVYVAGPFRGKTAWDVEQNIRRAEELGMRVAEAGFVPIIPHSMFRYFNGTLSDEFWIDGTLDIMRKCDAVILAPNWEASTGTRGEVKEATRLGLPVCNTLEDLLALVPRS